VNRSNDWLPQAEHDLEQARDSMLAERHACGWFPAAEGSEGRDVVRGLGAALGRGAKVSGGERSARLRGRAGWGPVNSPGSVLWQRGKGLGDYISAAGGFAYTADEGRTSVRYANGDVRTRHRTLIFRSDPTPGPGSEVIVPVRDLARRTDYVALVGAVAQIVASTVAIIVVVTK
jgi:hypothetical protein